MYDNSGKISICCAVYERHIHYFSVYTIRLKWKPQILIVFGVVLGLKNQNLASILHAQWFTDTHILYSLASQFFFYFGMIFLSFAVRGPSVALWWNKYERDMESQLVNLLDNTFMRNCPTRGKGGWVRERESRSRSFIFIYVLIGCTRATKVVEGASRTRSHKHQFCFGFQWVEHLELRWICTSRHYTKRLCEILRTKQKQPHLLQHLNTAVRDARNFLAQETKINAKQFSNKLFREINAIGGSLAIYIYMYI